MGGNRLITFAMQIPNAGGMDYPQLHELISASCRRRCKFHRVA